MTAIRFLVLPGGGYRVHGSEGPPAVHWLRELGVCAELCEYPLNVRHPAPLKAIRRSIVRLRDEGADRVGLVGFSAGGHAAGLAALAPTAGDRERVDVVIAGYPVVSFARRWPSTTRDTLIGRWASPRLRAETSLDRLVTPSAPPFFIWHTVEDAVIPVQHSYLLARALAAAGVAHELHVFPKGRHGLGLAEGSPGAEGWPALCRAWLTHQGLLT